MIVKGSSHTGRGLGDYLQQAKNERVEIWGVRGDLPRELPALLNDWRSDALGTNCKKPLYHAQLNPDRVLTREEWDKAISLFEKEMGFETQPRLIVLHEYKGREHLHLVYSRLDENGKAISDSWNYLHHEKAARAIETELGLDKTQGALYDRAGKERPERTPSQEAIQQSERTKLDPKEVKAEITQLYQQSPDDAQAFVSSLKEHGYTLAQGNRRGFVVVDQAGGVHSLSRASGAKAGELRELLKDYTDLPSVDAAREAGNTQPTATELETPQGAVGKEEAPNYWQDRIKAERDQDDPPPPTSPQGITPAEQKTAQSAFADPLLKIHEAEILEGGAIKHHGLVMTWVEHAIDYGAELVEGIKDKIVSKLESSLENNWQDYIRDREIERLYSPDKDGIDFDR